MRLRMGVGGIVTVHLIYEYFMVYPSYYCSIINIVCYCYCECMIMNALNTMPHSMCMYILCDTWQQRHIYWFFFKAEWIQRGRIFWVLFQTFLWPRKQLKVRKRSPWTKSDSRFQMNKICLMLLLKDQAWHPLFEF